MSTSSELREHPMFSQQYVVELALDYKVTIPVLAIGIDRAAHYASEFNNNTDESLLRDTFPLFLADSYEIEDWARNNMDWKDIQGFAITPSTTSLTNEQLQEGWVNPISVSYGTIHELFKEVNNETLNNINHSSSYPTNV